MDAITGHSVDGYAPTTQAEGGEMTAAAVRRALRPPRADRADADRHAMRTTLRRLRDSHADNAAGLEAAGYASREDFVEELDALLSASNQALTPRMLDALFGTSNGGGRLGRLLGIG